ncbi:uncharacterized protein RAG0_03500 [Rhynchosporium agropyri]|uniref:Uncharacterized protein n=1 Tax=Rhynchosporium agropyri TaxID=914238 RepID=A0A1E1K4I4_9HELO|nr:uncharacterized protein RAG0_03500 [Rhynchosporium agropyri]
MAFSFAKAAEMSAALCAKPSTSDEPPPPYDPSILPPNPGFCELAFRERLDNRIPGGGMSSAQYFAPCKSCGIVCGDEIPPVYKNGWLDWIDPSVNFRWESHVAIKKGEKDDIEERRRELLGCWICWEYEQVWREPMEVQEWYKHMRRHFFVEGYRICTGKTGAMQRRRNCRLGSCPKIHS